MTTAYQDVDRLKLTSLLDTELRHIGASHLTKLSSILDKARTWVELLSEISQPSSKFTDYQLPGLNITTEAADLIKRQLECGKSPSLALLNYWSITGRRRPTIRSLLIYLHLCNLKRAEEYVCQEILNIPSIDVLLSAKQLPESEPVSYPIDDIYKFDNLQELVDNLAHQCVRYSFESIYKSTNSFCHKPFNFRTQLGAKIGEGRFSTVYRAATQLESTYPNGKEQIIAAKFLKSECNKKYLVNEINLMGKVKHESILELLGLAIGKEENGSYAYICLVYKYMQNGSLLDCLKLGLSTKNMKFLTSQKRVEIATKVAKGISYLHGFQDGRIIHRDIKTANIFIDENIEPKLGDFTLVRQVEASRATATQFSQNVIGTSVYMPPEAFRGDISIKFDTFSFGIVLLELLTGMRPFNEELNEDLITYINDKLFDIDDEDVSTTKDVKEWFLLSLLDKKAGSWDIEVAKSLFKIALMATENRKKNRPEMSTLLPRLEKALSDVNELCKNA